MALVSILGLACAFLTPDAPLPYPPSKVIAGVSFDWSTHVRLAPGSDNWPITWADDGHQYTAWGDGGGFGGTNSDGRQSLGVARVEGDFDNYQGVNVWGGKNPENLAQFEGKSYGIISIGGVLNMWVNPKTNIQSYDEARMATSTDHGATWTQASWAFTKAEGLVFPTILNFGQDYAGARDGYVYSYFIRLMDSSDLLVQIPGLIDLARVPQGRILEQGAYEWYAGIDGNGNPRWTNNRANRQAVFEDANGVGWTVAVGHNSGLGRYLLTTEHTESGQGNLGIFEAPEPWGPWGPWSTVEYSYGWGITWVTEPFIGASPINGRAPTVRISPWFSPGLKSTTLGTRCGATSLEPLPVTRPRP